MHAANLRSSVDPPDLRLPISPRNAPSRQPQRSLLSPITEPAVPRAGTQHFPSTSPASQASSPPVQAARKHGGGRRLILSPDSPQRTPSSRPGMQQAPEEGQGGHAGWGPGASHSAPQQAVHAAPRMQGAPAVRQPALGAAGEQHLVHPAYRPGAQVPSPQTMTRPFEFLIPPYMHQSGAFSCAPNLGVVGAGVVYVPGIGVVPVAPAVPAQPSLPSVAPQPQPSGPLQPEAGTMEPPQSSMQAADAAPADARRSSRQQKSRRQYHAEKPLPELRSLTDLLQFWQLRESGDSMSGGKPISEFSVEDRRYWRQRYHDWKQAGESACRSTAMICTCLIHLGTV